MPYRDANYNIIGVQLRHRLEKGKGKDARFSWQENKPYLYGAWAIPRWREKETKRVFLCEGASDVQACWFNQIPALGVPGASAFKAEWASLLLPFSELCVIQEPGPAGEGFVKSIASALKETDYQGQVRVVSLSEKDPRDLWLKHKEHFKEKLEEAIAAVPVVDLYPPIPLASELILRTRDLVTRHVFFKDKRVPLLIATWVLGTYVYDVFTWFGYLWITSPVKRCGKSLLLDILRYLCWRSTPRLTNPTEAVIFRYAASRRTLILDEIEKLGKQDKDRYGAVMSVLNDGFHEGGTVARTERVEGKFEIVEYSTYCPKALAGINSLVDTIEDRCLKIPMVRRARTEKVERFNLREQRKDLEALQETFNLWADARRQAITGVYDGIGKEGVQVLSAVDDRFKDISEPLVAITTYADAEAMNGQQKIVPELISLLLAMAGKREESEKREAIGAFIPVAEEILGGQEKSFIESARLLERVKGIEELSWLESTKGLSSFLGKFDLHPKPKSGGNVRGYSITREWVEEAKSRYLGLILDSEPSQASQTRSQSGPEALF